MLNLQDELIVSNNGQGMYEITNNVHDWIVKNNIIKGQLNLFIQHTSASLTIPVDNKELQLGMWQGIYLIEHRYSKYKRKIILSYIGE